jgi:hypothetical protein
MDFETAPLLLLLIMILGIITLAMMHLPVLILLYKYSTLIMPTP